MRRSSGMAHANGFSVLEALIVLAIASLLASTAYSLIRRDPPNIRLKAAAHKMCATLREARSKAIAQNSEVEFTLDLVERSYSIDAKLKGAWPDNAETTVTTASNQIVQDTKATIIFFGNGSSSGGQIILEGAGHSVQLTINWFTGEATCAV